MSYEFFLQDVNNVGFEDITLVKAGSQLGSQLMCAHTKFPIAQFPIKKWYNLNNDVDIVFACRDIIASRANFKQAG